MDNGKQFWLSALVVGTSCVGCAHATVPTATDDAVAAIETLSDTREQADFAPDAEVIEPADVSAPAAEDAKVEDAGDVAALDVLTADVVVSDTDSCTPTAATGMCDDANTCTSDSCDLAKSTCLHMPLPDGTACGTGAECGVIGSCTAGACVGGDAPVGATTYGGVKGDAASALVALPDGYLIGGTTHSYGTGGADILVVRTDLVGKPLWQAHLGDPAVNEALGGIAVDGGTLLVAYSAPGALKLVALDPNGVTLWTKTLSDWGAIVGSSVVAASGHFVLPVASISPSLGGNPHLLAIDHQGGIIWNETLSAQIVNKIKRLTDGFVLCGMKYNPQTKKSEFWLGRLDEAGKQLWQSTVASSWDQTAMDDVAVLPDGYVLLAKAGYSGPPPDAVVIRTDTNGVVLWQRTIWLSPTETLSVAIAHQSGVVLAGQAKYNQTAGWLTGFDGYGNPDFGLNLYGTGGAGIAAIAKTAHGFAVAGTTPDKAGNDDFWLVRTDFWFNRSCSTSGTCAAMAEDACDDQDPCTHDECNTFQAGCSNFYVSASSTCGGGKTCATGSCE